MLVAAILGGTLGEVEAAIGRLAGYSLPHALQLPEQAALQPQGWLADRCVAFLDAPADTLWVGYATEAASSGKALSLEDAQAAQAAAARAVLLAFLTSHAILWLHEPGQLASGASTQLLRTLRLLQQLKSALLPCLPALLGVPPSEASAAQPGLCIPQLLLAVQMPGAAGGGSGPVPIPGSSEQQRQQDASSAAAEAQQQWAAAAERQLRRLLKACRVLVPEDSARALCTLPTAGPLVLCLPERLGSGSQTELVAAALSGLSLPAAGAPPTAAAQAASPATIVAAALAPQRAAVARAAGASSAGSAGSAAQELLHTWQQAVATLSAVLEAAALKAGGGTGSQPASGSAEQATAKAGQAAPAGTAAGAAQAAAVGQAPADVAVPSEAAAAAAWQQACSDAVRQFSLAACKRAAALASDAYRRNTPALLPAAGHAAAVQAALRLYRSLARGPAAADGARALQDQLDSYWREGHQKCDAVSFLGNPCCLPVHDPSLQPHASAPGAAGAAPALLLASGSGAQQHSIPEPFTVAELQRAAAAVAGDSASAAARAQFWVRQLGGEGHGTAGGASDAVAAAGAGAGGPQAGEEAEEGEGAAGGSGRFAMSGAAGQSSGEEAEEAEEEAAAKATAPGSAAQPDAACTAVAAAAAAKGLPAAGCWLELHVLGPRSQWRSAALSAALLMDGQPGWLRAGGVMFAVLPVLVAVPPKPGQQPHPQQQQQQQQQAAAAGQQEEADEFPSLAAVKERAQRQRQQQRAGGRGKKQQQQGAGAGPETPPVPQQPQLLTWPGWAAGDAAGEASAERLQQHGQRGPGLPAPARQRAQAGRGTRFHSAAGRGLQQAQQAASAVAASGPAASAAAAVAAGSAVAEQATLLLGFEYESVQGQRVLLTPALLAAALQSSLDAVSVRQQQQQQQPVHQGPATAAAGGAATTALASGPVGVASFLCIQDLPLWIQLPAEQLAALAGKRRGPGAHAAGPAGASPAPQAASAWLQLRRILVATPEVAVLLETDPVLLLEVPRDMLLPAGSGPGSGPSTVQLRYGLPAPLALPPGSFCMLALPWLLTAPTALAAAGKAAAGGGSAALILQSGPLKARLLGGSAVRPQADGGAQKA